MNWTFRQCLIYSSVLLVEKQRACNASIYRGRVHEDFNIEFHNKNNVETQRAQQLYHKLCWAQVLDDDKVDIATSKTCPKYKNAKKWGVLGTLQPYQHDNNRMSLSPVCVIWEGCLYVPFECWCQGSWQKQSRQVMARLEDKFLYCWSNHLNVSCFRIFTISWLKSAFAIVCCLPGQLLLLWLGYLQRSYLEYHSDFRSSKGLH